MIIIGNDQDEISSLQQYLTSEFKMKQLGNLKYFLGIEEARSKHGIFLCRKAFFTSNCRRGQFWFAASGKSILTVLSLPTGAKVSW